MKPTLHLQKFKTFLYAITTILAGLTFTPRLLAQGYIEHSRVIGGTGNQTVVDLIVEGGYSYILGTTTGNDYPVTLGGLPAGASAKGTLTKLDPSGNMVWSRYLPFGSGTATNSYTKMVLQNGVLYLLGYTSSTDVPVTNGSAYGGGTLDMLFTKVDAGNGSVLHNGYLGGNNVDGGALDLAVENGNAYISYNSGSSDIPVTTGPAFTAATDHVVQKIDAAGNIVYSTYTGRFTSGSITEYLNLSMKVENGIVYLAFPVGSNNSITTTDGSTHGGGVNDIGIMRLDANGTITMAKLIGGNGRDNVPALAINNGDIYIAAATMSSNYPVTDGSSRGSQNAALVLTKINSNGSLAYSSYRASLNVPITSIYILKPLIQYKNGSVYLAIAGYGGAIDMATTDGTTGSNALLKMDAATGAVQFATMAGQSHNTGIGSPIADLVITDDAIYTTYPILSAAAGAAFTTNGSTNNSPSGTFIAKHSLTGQLLYASYLTATTSNTTTGALHSIAAENGKVYVSGNTFDGNGWPVTNTALGTISPSDATWTVINFCPPLSTTNTIGPLTQSVCQNGFTQPLTGNEVVYTSQEVPIIYINGAPQQQNEIRARYQWQVSASATGPWSNIAAGTQKDYTPTPGTQTFYYRRLVLPPAGCSDIPVSISSVAEVVVGANAAPIVTGGIFNTCVNTAVDISATVTGGTAPYTYAWDNGVSSTTATATVTPTSNSVYTLTVTDNNGCQQVGQAIVNVYAADAGPASVSSCAGQPVRIGTAPPAGLSGVTYSWTPTAGLDDPTAAQPLATPGVTTVYTLQMTIPVSGGGTCTSSDNITVNVVTGPATPNFAGADQATCKGGSLSLGTAAEAGFAYTWSPGSYLSSVAASTTTFNAGTTVPQPNPFTYTLTASRNGCSFTDQVTVAVLDVDAGEDYCGPRTVGTADKTPGVTGKTFLWEVVSGPGTITGATNTPTTTVSASTSSTVYRVTVSYLGANCSDQVTVGPCGSGGCPGVTIDTLTNHGCPSAALGSVSLRASPSNLDPSVWTYTWTSVPAGGLSATTGTTISLTDNVERDVTVTISRIDNPAVNCSKTIHVNDPSWSLPVFNVPDQSICPATNIAIGAAPVAGYSYTWQKVNAIDINSSNPVVSPSVTTNYPVTVTEMASGCELHDTVKVTVKTLIVNPGPDWVVCNNAMIKLGSPAQPGYTYSWNPQLAAYQNGTTYQSAEPEVLIAATQDFTLTVTDTETGCTADSTIHIVVDAGTALPAMTDTTICQGGSATIGLPTWGGVTYSWSPATGLSSTTIAQPTASPAATQIYTLVVTFYDPGGAPICTKSGSVTVTVASPQITMSDESVCPSGALYNLNNNVSVTGATTYQWAPALLVTNPNVLNTTVKANPGTPTTFTLTATDAKGCISVASKVISPLNAAPEAGSQGYICVGESRVLGASSNSGTLSWTVSPAIAGTLSPANGAEPIFTPAAADAGKTFTFTLTQNIGGCINVDSTKMLVRSLALPSMSAQTICMNAPATIGVASVPNVTYAWTPTTGLANPTASTTTVSSVSSNSVYTLTATDAYGCTATGDAVIGVNPVPAPSVTIPDVTVMMGSPGTPFSPQIAPTPASYTYTWSPAQTLDNPYIANAKATPGPVGTYTFNLAVTDENGCTTTAPARMNVTMPVTLPITIASFTADIKDCGVQLNWKVELQDNFSHFIVERSNDGRNFRSIGTIYLNPERQMYRFDDADPGNGSWFYRLRLVDLDGSIRYSKIVSVKVNCASKEMLIVYPNPIAENIYIRSSKPVQRVQLYSLTGQIVLQKEYRQSQAGVILMTIGTKLRTGMYMLRITQADGSIQTTKVIKE